MGSPKDVRLNADPGIELPNPLLGDRHAQSVTRNPTGIRVQSKYFGTKSFPNSTTTKPCCSTLSVYTSPVKKIRVNVMLGKDQLAALKKKVAANDTTVSQVLRRLIDGYLKKK
jgi:hypothetical protein